MPLTRDQILSANDITIETVPVPEWGGEVCVKTLSGAERDHFEAVVIREDSDGKQRTDLENIRATLASMAICDDAGRPLFSQADVESLGRKNAAALDRVWTVAQRLSRISQEDIDELKKRSAAAAGSSSSAGCVSPSAAPAGSSSPSSTPAS